MYTPALFAARMVVRRVEAEVIDHRDRARVLEGVEKVAQASRLPPEWHRLPAGESCGWKPQPLCRRDACAASAGFFDALLTRVEKAG